MLAGNSQLEMGEERRGVEGVIDEEGEWKRIGNRGGGERQRSLFGGLVEKHYIHS